MKVIDLLQRIANSEELPKCFKVNNHTWEWNVNSYQNELHGEFAVTGLRYDLSNLNDEVEIIEDKKIEKLDEYACVSGDLACKWTFSEEKLKDKINEIIDIINKGDK